MDLGGHVPREESGYWKKAAAECKAFCGGSFHADHTGK